jgi:hypothetical protein
MLRIELISLKVALDKKSRTSLFFHRKYRAFGLLIFCLFEGVVKAEGSDNLIINSIGYEL